MKKQKQSKNLLLLLGIILLGVLMFKNNNQAASIGIIEGADGPTAVFVASKFSSLLRNTLILLGAIILYKTIKGLFK